MDVPTVVTINPGHVTHLIGMSDPEESANGVLLKGISDEDRKNLEYICIQSGSLIAVPIGHMMIIPLESIVTVELLSEPMKRE